LTDYWRRSNESDKIYTCVGVSKGCEGGNQTGDASCSTGYDGVLCGSCSKGNSNIHISINSNYSKLYCCITWYAMKGYYSSSRKCRKCSRKFSLKMILTICFVVVVGKSSDFHVPIFPIYVNWFISL
jgi:hypothetical protein